MNQPPIKCRLWCLVYFSTDSEYSLKARRWEGQRRSESSEADIRGWGNGTLHLLSHPYMGCPWDKDRGVCIYLFFHDTEFPERESCAWTFIQQYHIQDYNVHSKHFLFGLSFKASPVNIVMQVHPLIISYFLRPLKAFLCRFFGAYTSTSFQKRCGFHEM